MLEAIEKEMAEAVGLLVPGRAQDKAPSQAAAQAQSVSQKPPSSATLTGPKSRAALLVLPATAVAWPTD